MYFILNDREHLGKFNLKNDEGVFLGYSCNSRAFCVYNMRPHSIIKSKNVVINDYKDFTDYSIEEERTSLLETLKDVTVTLIDRVIENVNLVNLL